MLVLLLIVGVVHAQDGGVPGADGIGDPDFPLLGNGGYDVQHYTLDLAADVEANTLSGTVTITGGAYGGLCRPSTSILHRIGTSARLP